MVGQNYASKEAGQSWRIRSGGTKLHVKVVKKGWLMQSGGTTLCLKTHIDVSVLLETVLIQPVARRMSRIRQSANVEENY